VVNKKPAQGQPLAGYLGNVASNAAIVSTESGERLAALVPPAAALSLAPLGAVFLLDADEAQAAAMLADDARTLDPLREPA
jgi:hypothetical protein